MNYYEQKKQCEWNGAQTGVFKKSETFLKSEAFKVDGQKALIWLRQDGLALSNDHTERFENAVQPFADWKKTNYSPVEELKYNTWMETQKANFKETSEYKNSEFAKTVCYPLEKDSKLPHGDGIEVYENGTIELCSGEKFESAVTPLSEFKSYGPDIEEIIDTSVDIPNHYEGKKVNEWDCEQATLFAKTESFKNSEAFKHQGSDVEIVVEYDGSVILTDDGEKKIFPNAVMSWEDWKQENYSEKEEFEYNKNEESRVYPTPDPIVLKEENQVEQEESEEFCMSM